MSSSLGMPGAGPAETLLPSEDKVLEAFQQGADPDDIAREHPASPFAWALMADLAWANGEEVPSYAFARVGYHRGLDALRKAGWKGAGRIPYSHQGNHGFLRCLVALQRAAKAIGEEAEVERIGQFLDEADPTAKVTILNI